MQKGKLTIVGISELLGSGDLKVSEASFDKIERSFKFLQDRVNRTGETIYGVNTGFGSLSDIRIDDDGLESLQSNLILSHACGTGKRVPNNIVRAMLCLKVENMLYGSSGVHKDTVVRLVDHFNHDVLPVIYTQGSLGASGDLAPLAHLCLPLIGEGNVVFKGCKYWLIIFDQCRQRRVCLKCLVHTSSTNFHSSKDQKLGFQSLLASAKK